MGGHLLPSKEKAKILLLQYQDVQSSEDTKAEIMASVEKQTRFELNHFSQLLDQLVNQTKRILSIKPFTSGLRLSLSEKQCIWTVPISELNIWQATGAAVIALSHNEELLLHLDLMLNLRQGYRSFYWK